MQKSKWMVLVAAFASGTALAQSSPQDTSGASGDSSMSAVARLEQETEEGVKYVCGGIGAEEVASLKKAASGYDLMMTFAASTGAYIANVDVEIDDAGGRPVFNVNCDAPILLVDLPHDGRYRIRADAEGRTLVRTAQVNERSSVQQVQLAWPVQTVDMGLSPGAGPQPSDESMTGSGSSGSEERRDAPGAEAR